nr:uncharacterized mitochondrial protein AtMg00810-like [Tanacetum cinerariifolium]
METILVMTPGTLSSRLVPQPLSSTPFVPPIRDDCDTLLQPLFDEYFCPPPWVDHPVPKVAALVFAVLTDSPSSRSVNQDAPPLSILQTLQASPSHVITPDTKEPDHDIEVAHIDNNPQYAMQEELNEFEHLEVWELVPRPDRVMIITLKWIYKVKLDELGGLQISQSPRGVFLNQSKYTLEIIKKYGIENSDPMNTLMVKKSKLDADPQGKEVDPTRYHGMIGSLMYLTASRPDLQFVVCMCARYHFIKEQVENRVVELYFVRTKYQLEDIFTKALGQERPDFLINKLGMRSMSPETLKNLADEEDKINVPMSYYEVPPKSKNDMPLRDK